jgi:putative SOS response-associated peptidase YedK
VDQRGGFPSPTASPRFFIFASAALTRPGGAPIVRAGVDGERETRHGALGHAEAASIRRRARHEHPQSEQPSLARMARPGNCCLVPATPFCEYADTKPRKTPIWFALAYDRPLFAFAGLWASWRGVGGPKSAPVQGEHQLFDFLTTDANAIVAPIHPKAMPVILTTAAEVDQWLEADTVDALALQRPLPDDLLRIVAKGEKEDSPGHLRSN